MLRAIAALASATNNLGAAYSQAGVATNSWATLVSRVSAANGGASGLFCGKTRGGDSDGARRYRYDGGLLSERGRLFLQQQGRNDHAAHEEVTGINVVIRKTKRKSAPGWSER